MRSCPGGRERATRGPARLEGGRRREIIRNIRFQRPACRGYGADPYRAFDLAAHKAGPGPQPRQKPLHPSPKINQRDEIAVAKRIGLGCWRRLTLLPCKIGELLPTSGD